MKRSLKQTDVFFPIAHAPYQHGLTKTPLHQICKGRRRAVNRTPQEHRATIMTTHEPRKPAAWRAGSTVPISPADPMSYLRRQVRPSLNDVKLTSTQAWPSRRLTFKQSRHKKRLILFKIYYPIFYAPLHIIFKFHKSILYEKKTERSRDNFALTAEKRVMHRAMPRQYRFGQQYHRRGSFANYAWH